MTIVNMLLAGAPLPLGFFLINPQPLAASWGRVGALRRAPFFSEFPYKYTPKHSKTKVSPLCVYNMLSANI